jgi:hypothetical protein
MFFLEDISCFLQGNVSLCSKNNFRWLLWKRDLSRLSDSRKCYPGRSLGQRVMPLFYVAMLPHNLISKNYVIRCTVKVSVFRPFSLFRPIAGQGVFLAFCLFVLNIVVSLSLLENFIYSFYQLVHVSDLRCLLTKVSYSMQCKIGLCFFVLPA